MITQNAGSAQKLDRLFDLAHCLALTLALVEAFFIGVSIVYSGDIRLGMEIGFKLWLCLTVAVLVTILVAKVMDKLIPDKKEVSP